MKNTKNACKQAVEDMRLLQEEAGLVLTAACMYTHRNKVKLLKMLRELRGIKK